MKINVLLVQCLFYCFFIQSNLNGQNYSYAKWQWGKIFNMTSFKPPQMCYKDGYVYVSGNFDSTIQIEQNIFVNNGGNDVYITKWDTLGNLMWANTISYIGNQTVSHVEIGKNNELYILGNYDSIGLQVGTSNINSVGGTDIFISKYDLNGNLLSLNQFGTTNNDSIYFQPFLDHSDNIYFTTNNNGYGLIKITNSGNLIWNQNYIVSKDLYYSPSDSTLLTITTYGVQGFNYLVSSKWDLNGNLIISNQTNISFNQAVPKFKTTFNKTLSFYFICFQDSNLVNAYIPNHIYQIDFQTGSLGVSVLNIGDSKLSTFVSDKNYIVYSKENNKSGIYQLIQSWYPPNNTPYYTSSVYKEYYYLPNNYLLPENPKSILFVDTNLIFTSGTLGGINNNFGRLGVDSLVLSTSQNNVTICQGNQTQLYGITIGGVPPYTYSWTPSQGLSSTNSDTTYFSATSNISYTLTVTDNSGQIAHQTFNITVGVPFVVPNITSQFSSFCQEDSMLLFSNTTGITGHWKRYLNGNWLPYFVNGSDSLITTTIYNSGKFLYQINDVCGLVTDTIDIVNNKSFSYEYNTVCLSQLPFSWHNQLLNSPGYYHDTLLNSFGCDSIISFNLVVYPNITYDTSISICSNQLPYIWHGQNILTSGIYNDTSLNILGCDTISTLHLMVNPISSSFDTLTVCSNQVPYVWNGQSLSQSGIYQDTLINSEGCDSTATLQLLINPSPQPSILWSNSLLVCTNSANVNYQWYFNNLLIGTNADTVTITQNGLYWVMTTDSLGCIGIDSIHIISLGSSSVLLPLHDLKLYPNPTSNSIFIDYFLLKETKMSLQIVDVVGNVITKMSEEKQVQGQHSKEINLQSFHLSNGVYLLQLSDGIHQWNLPFMYRP